MQQMINGSQMKGIHKKTTANDILNSKPLKAFSLRSDDDARYYCFYQHWTGGLML